MKTLQQILDKAGFTPTNRFRVPSRSGSGTFHIVKVFADNHLECDCPRAIYRKGGNECRHTEVVKKYLQKQTEKC